MSGTSSAASVQRPRAVTAALVLVLLAALLNAVIGGFVLTQIGPIRTVWLREAAAGSSGPDPTVFLIALAAIALLYAAAITAFAVLFRAGRPWARVALFGTTLLSLFALFPPNLPALAVVLLLAAVDVLLYRAPVTAWVRGLRGLRAA